jgi:hypothetical protein
LGCPMWVLPNPTATLEADESRSSDDCQRSTIKTVEEKQASC